MTVTRRAPYLAPRRTLSALTLGLCLTATTEVALAQTVPPERDQPAVATQTAAGQAVLLADDLTITADDRLIATGNVEALYKGRRLTASQVIYNRTTEELSLIGPVTIINEDGNIATAASGRVDRDLYNGILRSARVVMDQNIQLAAVEMQRAGGRYSQLYKAAVTSCRVCNAEAVPLWQIRAVRVIHDQQERQLYFHNAQFRVLDVPIAYLPRLRLPDPTLDRATGLLVPSLHNSSILGFGARVPYFIKLGDHRDLTLTPFLTAKSRTLEYRYRQAFWNGDIEINGAFSDDDVREGKLRGYVFAGGRFELQKDFVLSFGVEASRDKTYLLDYNYSDIDRLNSRIAVERNRRDEHIRVSLDYFHSLRDGESNRTLPTLATQIDYERRLFPTRVGGELRLSGTLHGHRRSSDLDSDGPDFDIWADGRDVGRLNLRADWQRSWIWGSGLRTDVNSGLAFDAFEIHQAGNTSKSHDVGLVPYISSRLSWPWQMTTGYGVSHVIEPMLQTTWIGGARRDIPNDESTEIEFDEGNLFGISRFYENDRWERGAMAAYGVTWTRFDPKGWQGSLAAGQVWRDKVLYEHDGSLTFSKSSGLQTHHSDVLIAGQIRTQDGFSLTGRGIFDKDFDVTKAEARAFWRNKRARIGATYLWLSEDPAEYRTRDISEVAIDGSYRVSRHWTVSGGWRYDIAQDEKIRAKGGLRYTNECVDVELSASRRFTSTTNLDPSTDINLTVALRGFTAKTRDGSYTRRCRK